jgi:diguanylate cyclase (GGDEF)-like protein
MSATHATDHVSAWPRLKDLALGKDPHMRATTGLCLLAAALYMTWCLITYLVCIPTGLLSPAMGYTFMVQEIAACLTIYPLVRSGLTRHWADRGLVVPQMVWASAASVVAYASMASTRPVFLQTLCLIQVFGFFSLKPRQARWLGGINIMMLLIMLVVMTVIRPADFDLPSESLKVGTSCFILALMAWQSSNFAQFRQKVSKDKRHLQASLEEVHRIALHDALTGLPNRQFMQERMEAELLRTQQTGSHFSLALLDLDHFKRINDEHGHHVGDEALIAFARTTRNAMRETDMLGRWGGEEFVVMMLDTEPAPLGVTALNRVRANLACTTISHSAPDLRVQFSAGLTHSRPNERLEQLMNRADKALYEAKAKGRNRTCIAPLPDQTTKL